MTDNRTDLSLDELEQVTGGHGGSPTKLPEEPGTIVYKIGRGENLSRIARRYGVTVDDILAVNRDTIANRNNITAGYYIYIPD